MTRRSSEVQSAALAAMERSEGPMSAYQLLDALSRPGARLAPQTVYRALRALVARGEAHRIESINAYVACRHPDHVEPAILSICDACGAVEEHLDPAAIEALGAAARRTGFEPARPVVELHGRCGGCAEGA